jgi:hypothetical protein
MKRNFSLWFLAVIVALLVQSISANAATNDCSWMLADRTFAHQFGGYGNFYDVIGKNFGGGYFEFGHNGKYKGMTTLGVAQFAFLKDLPVSGTYTAEWNFATTPPTCAGQMVEDGPMGNVMQFVVGARGQSLELMHVDENGLVLGITALPMHTDRCSLGTLHSVYTYNAKGWILPPPLPPGFPMPTVGGFAPIGFSGAISFDGRGHLKGWDTVSINGMIMPRTFSGNYSVGPNCVSSMTMVDTIGNTIHTENFILKYGKAIQVVNTDVMPDPATPECKKDCNVVPTTILSFTATEAAYKH